MPSAAHCPDPSALRRFTLGLLPEPEAEPLGQHLLACSHCVDTLNKLRAKDTLIDALRGNVETPPPASAVDALMDRLARRPPPLTLPGAVVCRKTDEALPGQIGRYQILGLLGAGGMGTVYRAYDAQLCRDVAVKVPRFDGPREAVAEARQRFLREARAAAAIRNPHVCPIYDVSEQDGRPYVVIALVEGCSLAERLKEKPPLNWREAAALAGQVADALAAVHAAGLVHRDLKPGNILLDRDGRALLTDFGLARAERDHEHLTEQGALLGTPSYMAPEQTQGDAVDARSDLFSLGVVLYELCTGQLPFRGNSAMAVLNALATATPVPPAQINPALPTELSELVQQLLARDAAQRPASARAVAERLEGLLRQASVQTSASTAALRGSSDRNGPPAGKRRLPRRRLLLAGLAALLVLAPLGFLYGGAIVRIVTNKGELVIETSDPDVEVTVKGDRATVYDKVKERRFVLTAGDYEVEVREVGEGGLRFDTKRFAITRGGTETFNAVLKPKEKPGDGTGEDATTKPPPKPDEIKGDERKAAEWVLSIGGRVQIFSDGQLPWITEVKDLPAGEWQLVEIWLNQNDQVTDAGLEHLQGLTNLTALGLNNTLVGDVGMESLKTLTNMRRLGLNGTGVGDAGLANLKAMTKLTVLDLTGNQRVNGSGLKHLGELTGLTELHLSSSRLDDAGLEHIKAFKNLRVLSLGSTRVTDAGLVNLKDLTNLTYLLLNEDQGVTGPGLVYLKGLTNLTQLHMAGSQVNDAGLAHIKTLTNLSLLGLNRTRVTDAGLIHLEGLTNLTYLDLPVVVGDAGVEHLKNLTNLAELRLEGTQVGDAGLEYLKPLTKLSFLRLDSTQVGDAGLKHLESLTQLGVLHLSSTRVTDAGMEHLKHLINLTELHLWDVRVGNEGMAPLQKLTNLRVLQLGRTQVGDAGMAPLKNLTNLTTLYLDETQVGDAGLAHLENLTNLQILHVYNHVTDAGLAHLKTLTNLTGLLLNNNQGVTGAGLESLKNLKSLWHLHLDGTQVDDAGLDHLKGLTNLAALSLSNTKVTEEGVKRLKESLPNCNIGR